MYVIYKTNWLIYRANPCISLIADCGTFFDSDTTVSLDGRILCWIERYCLSTGWPQHFYFRSDNQNGSQALSTTQVESYSSGSVSVNKQSYIFIKIKYLGNHFLMIFAVLTLFSFPDPSCSNEVIKDFCPFTRKPEHNHSTSELPRQSYLIFRILIFSLSFSDTKTKAQDYQVRPKKQRV